MQGRYGSLWVDRWRTGQLGPNGNDVGLDNAMDTWGEELSGFADQPERIRQAIESSKGQPMPPTLPEFIIMCRQATPTRKPAITRQLTQEEIQRGRESARKLSNLKMGEPGLGWAHKLRERYLAKEVLPDMSIRYASEVIGETWKDGKCSKIEREPLYEAES